ncbi:hypothetical protein JW906_05030 [bacterium]|nr:hypothetical protein [bacterium]
MLKATAGDPGLALKSSIDWTEKALPSAFVLSGYPARIRKNPAITRNFNGFLGYNADPIYCLLLD